MANRADKAVLRLAIGLGLAVLAAYGLALPAPFVICVMAALVLCKPGPPIPFFKGAVMAVFIAALIAAGVLMVPILENYAVAGNMLTGVMLYAAFYAGARSANPMTTILVIAFTLIPVAGVADQALASTISVALTVGIGTGVLVNIASHAFPRMFLDPPARQRRPPPSVGRQPAGSPCAPRSLSYPSSC